ncbi:MAG: DUF2461 domain-containing protein [Syntrophothermus sp.]
MNSSVLSFLSDLQLHNDREWFQKNKQRYEEAKNEFEVTVNHLIAGISKFDDSVKYLVAKDCMFRIFRDVRFSNDKSPYKTNFGAWMSKGGRKHSGPGYYLHIQPGESFIAGGVYMPDPDTLKKIRQEIFYNLEEFSNILEEKKAKKLFGGLDEFDKGKLPPKGYPKDFAGIDYLKNKHFILTMKLNDNDIVAADFLKKTISGFEAMKGFQEFLRKAVE